jgi:hypothetical protein
LWIKSTRCASSMTYSVSTAISQRTWKACRHVCALLQAARKACITLNLEKFQFAQPKVSWVGYEIQHGGFTADPSKLQAISRFPRPKNITEPRSFMGLVEQLAEFSSDVAAAKGPLRPLLSSRNLYTWQPTTRSAGVRGGQSGPAGPSHPGTLWSIKGNVPTGGCVAEERDGIRSPPKVRRPVAINRR